eukprot:jgi/Chrzof1/13298/Cz07g28020.t1
MNTCREAQARGPINPNGDPVFIENTTRFLRECAAHQIQLLPTTFCSLCRKYKDQLVAAGHPRMGILPLQSAIQRLQPNPEHLTPIHADFLQLCLLAKCYNAALPVLDEDILETDPHQTSLTPTDFLLYCYYGGMIHIGRKQYARAVELFVQAMTSPTMVGNAITVACYKKYVLTSLIHTGTVPALPKFTPSKVRQVVEGESRAYQELSTAYTSHNPDKLRKAAEQHMAVFSQDNNVGLVKQVLASLPVRTIQRLTQTYVTLSLADIATTAGLTGPDEAESYILRMVASGEVHARINERDGMVTFIEDPEAYNSSGMAAKIEGAVSKCMQLAEKLQAVNEAVSLDRSYINKVMLKERHFGGTPDDFGTGLLYQP